MVRILCLLVAALALLGCSAPPSGGAPPQIGTISQASTASQWDQILAEAKREGKVVVIGPQGSEARDALTLGFQARYPDIEVDLTSTAGDQIAPKLTNELAANHPITDVLVAGSTTVLEALRPADAIVPVQDYLVGPNVRDTSVWRNGKLNFSDDAGQYNLIFSAYTKEGFIYNPTLVNPNEITSYRDLLDPRWRGKMVMRNPMGAGGGQGIAAFFYAVDSLGTDFIRQFFSQDVLLANDDRQILDWVARGQYPIAFGASNVLTNDYIRRGLPVALMPKDKLRESSFLTSGNGTLAIARSAPHPNATRVYVDWLLSKDGQTDWVKTVGFASLRRDVPAEDVDPALVPQDGVEYLELQSERNQKTRAEAAAFISTILSRR